MIAYLQKKLSTARQNTGSASIELAILAPVIFLMLALLVSCFRVYDASSRVSGVAGAAAREASLERDPIAAELRGKAAGYAALQDKELNCINSGSAVKVTMEVASNGARIARAEVKCQVPLSDLGLGIIKGTRTLKDSATSPWDQFREKP